MSSKQTAGSIAKKQTRGQIKEHESKEVGSKSKIAKVKPIKLVKEKSDKLRDTKKDAKQTKEPCGSKVKRKINFDAEKSEKSMPKDQPMKGANNNSTQVRSDKLRPVNLEKSNQAPQVIDLRESDHVPQVNEGETAYEKLY